MPKGTSQAEATSNSEKIKLIVLDIIKLCLSEGISQSVRRKFFSIIFLNFCSNFLEEFQVDLKACLGLILSNQNCPIVVWEN